MNELYNIFLKIDYDKEIVYVNYNKPFISHLHYTCVMNSKDNPYITNCRYQNNWSFDFLGRALKYCSVDQIKKFLKLYPEFLEYFI